MHFYHSTHAWCHITICHCLLTMLLQTTQHMQQTCTQSTAYMMSHYNLSLSADNVATNNATHARDMYTVHGMHDVTLQSVHTVKIVRGNESNGRHTWTWLLADVSFQGLTGSDGRVCEYNTGCDCCTYSPHTRNIRRSLYKPMTTCCLGNWT